MDSAKLLSVLQQTPHENIILSAKELGQLRETVKVLGHLQKRLIFVKEREW